MNYEVCDVSAGPQTDAKPGESGTRTDDNHKWPPSGHASLILLGWSLWSYQRSNT